MRIIKERRGGGVELFRKEVLEEMILRRRDEMKWKVRKIERKKDTRGLSPRSFFVMIRE